MCFGVPGSEEQGPCLLLIEPAEAPIFVNSSLRSAVWSETLRPRPCKVFFSYWKENFAPFNCSWGIIYPNTRLELQPSEYSQKASLSFENQGTK